VLLLLLLLQVNFTADQVVWQERDPTNSQFFLIHEGTASQKDAATGAITAKLGPGKYFGQQSLVGSGKLGLLRPCFTQLVGSGSDSRQPCYQQQWCSNHGNTLSLCMVKH
jgi:hypothetical protein